MVPSVCRYIKFHEKIELIRGRGKSRTALDSKVGVLDQWLVGKIEVYNIDTSAVQ